jgi:CHAT domain-containing protein
VVCPLWGVDDRPTARLKTDLYGGLQRERPAADALRKAKRRMIQAGQAPLYRAPFALLGE